MGAASIRGARHLSRGGAASAQVYASQLLNSLGRPAAAGVFVEDEHPAVRWAQSGLMQLTGHADGAPQMCPVPLASCADGGLGALRALATPGVLDGCSGAELLCERAARVGHTRQGSRSAGGACQLLAAADGHIAANLPRPDDWAAAAAWLESTTIDVEDWTALAAIVAKRTSSELVERARWVGLAVSAVTRPSGRSVPWFRLAAEGPRGSPGARRPAPVVVDLSSLWAGPLCTRLLDRLGARIIKVESRERPDGARNGAPGFFDALNAGKASVALDITTAQGREQLRGLLSRADIVVEASRPRALRQLGIDAEQLVRQGRGLTWLSITGYGRDSPQDQWIAYGDDAAVAAGLSSLLFDATGHWLIGGDAIADPLAGLHAALATWASHLSGGGRLISVALCDVMRHAIQFDLPRGKKALQTRNGAWGDVLERRGVNAEPPRAPPLADRGRPLGADTAAILAEFGIAA